MAFERHPELWDNDLVRKHHAQAQEWLVKQQRDRLEVDASCQVTDRPVQSPIEAVFVLWFTALLLAEPHHSVEAHPQREVVVGEHAYRIDFVITPANTDVWSDANDEGFTFPNFAVELDGHDFHERTKEQVIWRDQRDRDLQRAGWRVFHFSGSELVRTPEKCVREVVKEAGSAYWEMYHNARNQRVRRFLLEQRATENNESEK